MQDVRAAAKGAVAVARIASVGAGFGTDIAAAFDDDVPVVIGSVVHAAAAAAAAVDRTKRTPPQGATAQPPLSRRRQWRPGAWRRGGTGTFERLLLGTSSFHGSTFAHFRNGGRYRCVRTRWWRVHQRLALTFWTSTSRTRYIRRLVTCKTKKTY